MNILFCLHRYNLVTPLTSMIVLRKEDKKRIEEQLKKEQEEREKEEKRREEERKRKLEEEELLRTSSRLTSGNTGSSASIQAPSSNSPVFSGGGFSGDPHFLIPIRPDFYICFDWDGESGEV